MKTNKLSDSNFVLIVIGQIISLFGNGILRFALPLHLLHVTGSSAIFGIVSALSFLPLIILMPIGGIIADRVNKKNIMVVLDLLTAAVTLGFCILSNQISIIPLIIITLMILYGISGLYQPAVQASVPSLLDTNILMKGNSIISSISAISNLLAPVIGGFLFGIYGVYPIVLVSVFCFFISAILELFIKIPHKKVIDGLSVIQIAKHDISVSSNFIFKQKPAIAKIIFVICVINAFVSSMIMISLPILVTNKLGLPAQYYGISQGVIGFGALFGGVMTGILGEKLKVNKLHKSFVILSIALIPLVIAPLVSNNWVLSYLLILSSSFFIMCIATIVSIQIMTYVQSQSDDNIVGKVMALLITISICSQPIGQTLYGVAFEYFKGYESCIIFIGVLASLSIAIYSKKIFKEKANIK